MTDHCKNSWDVLISLLTLGGAAVAFYFSLAQWRRAQTWQKAEKLDDLITKFESDELLRVAMVVLDWWERDFTFGQRTMTTTSEDARIALSTTGLQPNGNGFTDTQVVIRDAYDALLSYFQRLQTGITGGLIDAHGARSYFGYWLERWVRFDRHSAKALNRLWKSTVVDEVAAYTKEYADSGSLVELCRQFKLPQEYWRHLNDSSHA